MRRPDPLIDRAHVYVHTPVAGPELLRHDDFVEYNLVAQHRHALDRHIQQPRQVTVEVLNQGLSVILHERIGDDVVERTHVPQPTARHTFRDETPISVHE